MKRNDRGSTPPYAEFVALVGAHVSIEALDRSRALAGDVKMVDSLAHRYWVIKKGIDMTDPGTDRMRILEEDPVNKAVLRLTQDLGDAAAVPVRQLMVGKYGFAGVDVERLSDATVLEVFFDHLGYITGSFRDEAAGRQFTRPLFEGQRSRLDLIKTGEGARVHQHSVEGLLGGGT